jgi:hypothetical protein
MGIKDNADAWPKDTTVVRKYFMFTDEQIFAEQRQLNLTLSFIP